MRASSCRAKTRRSASSPTCAPTRFAWPSKALTEVRDRIKTQCGDPYVPDEANRYRVKTNAQDAREAIRPTSMK